MRSQDHHDVLKGSRLITDRARGPPRRHDSAEKVDGSKKSVCPLNVIVKVPFQQYLTYTMGKQLVVFDFDWSFVDQDTDRWVFEVLSTELRRLLQDRKKGQGTGIQCTPDVV